MSKPFFLPYERLGPDIWKHIAVVPGESVIVRQAFRWHRDGKVVSNAYECWELQSVCDDHNWKIVERYGEHIAIIEEATT